MTDKKPTAIPGLPVMWNILIFAGLALIGLIGVLSLEALTGAEFGEAEWGLINLILGGVAARAGDIMDIYKGLVAPKE